MRVRCKYTGQEATVIQYPEGLDPYWLVEFGRYRQWWLPDDFTVMPEDLGELTADYDLIEPANVGRKSYSRERDDHS